MPRGFIDGEYQDGELRGRVFLAGMQKTGKTTEMMRVLGTCSGPRIMHDTLGTHGDKFPHDFLANQPGELKIALLSGRKRILYQPKSGGLVTHFERVNEIVKILGKPLGGVAIAYDELDALCKKDDDGDAPKMPRHFRDLIEYGRHYRVAMMFTTRTPPSVPRRVTAACQELRLFHTGESLYREFWAKRLGRKEVDAMLNDLPEYHYLLHRDGARELAVYCAGKPVLAKTLAKVPK